MSKMAYRSAKEIVGLIRAGEISPTELMQETLDRIEAVNSLLNAFVALRAGEAMEEARRLTESLAHGEEPGPLAGIPIGVKDMEDVAGMVTSFGSVPYRENVARKDSIQVERLKRAGAIVVGKTNTPEFGFTGFTKNRLYGVTRNPWKRDRTPGGSSGGSAAAVSSGLVPIATGSDAGGSIRIPASYTGCFGLKPSFGRIPMGPTPFLQMFSMMTLGPLTRTVSDAAIYLDCVAGYHPCDPLSLPATGISFSHVLEKPAEGLKIAFSPRLGYARVEREVMNRVSNTLKVLEKAGHRIENWEGTLPDTGETWSRLMNSELYGMLHLSLEKNRNEMGRTLVHSLDLAKTFSMRDQIEAQKQRTQLNKLLWELFEQYDLLVTPTMPIEAFSAEGPPPGEIDGQPVPLLGSVAFTYPFNLSGHPAASVPAGFTENGLPVGLQIIGPHHREDLVLQLAYTLEEAQPWHPYYPEGIP